MGSRREREAPSPPPASSHFFERDDVRHALYRAHIVAQTPLSVHTMTQGGASNSCAHGNCDACRYIANLPWGKQACRTSREKAARRALRRNRTVPFMCHMGFSCVTVAANVTPHETVAITLGPFCPDETPDSLDVDALRGLQALSHKRVEKLPFTLDDVSRVPARSMPYIAEWIADTLSTIAGAIGRESTRELLPASRIENVHEGRKALRDKPVRDPYESAKIAVALLSGDQQQARTLVQRQITDAGASGRLSIALKRARAISVVSSTLEAAERAGMPTLSCWERYSSFLESARTASNEAVLSRVSMKVLGLLKPKKATLEENSNLIAQLDRIVTQRPPEGLKLQDVAAIMGVHPTTITHRLQRKFGVSFTEYIGRVRVDAAKELLQRTQLTVSAIARRAGLSDSTNFSRLFRKFEGMSPTAYRKRYQSRLSPTSSRRTTR